MKAHFYSIILAAAISSNFFSQNENHPVSAAAGEIFKSSDSTL